MLSLFISGGPFMIILIIFAIIIGFVAIKNLKEPFFTHSLIGLGVLSVSFGMLATYIGLNSAFNAVPDINMIAPSILMNGVKTSLVTTFTGGFILVVSTLLWYVMLKKHNIALISTSD